MKIAKTGDGAHAIGAQPSEPATGRERPTHTLAFVLKCTEDHVTYLHAGDAAPVTQSRAEFASNYASQALQAVPQAPTLAGEDAALEVSGTFGFRWFVPELLRHRSIWRDVMLASLFIQLMAIGTPLFTQVIIDKVILNQTLSTLTVLAIALGLFIL